MDTADQLKQRVQMRKTPVGQFLWDKCGMDYYDTESAARRVAEKAVEIADENKRLRDALLKAKEFVQSWGELIDTQYPLWNECTTTIQKALPVQPSITP